MPQPETVIATSAVVVSIIALGTSIYFGWATRDHNRKSVKPLPYVLQPDFEDRLAVRVRNNGIGPMILQQAQARDSVTNRSGHLVDLIPDPPPGFLFANFNRIEQPRAILPGDEVDLLDLVVPADDTTAVAYRDQLRQALGHISVELTYTDIYDSKFQTYVLKLNWFHRNSEKSA